MFVSVVVCRAFANGWDQAFDPSLQPLLDEIRAVLNPIVDDKFYPEKLGPFQQELPRKDGPSGYLVGEIQDDPDTPHLLARTRHPTILRAALVGKIPTPEEAEALRDRLRELTPEEKGENELLRVSLDAPLSNDLSWPPQPREKTNPDSTLPITHPGQEGGNAAEANPSTIQEMKRKRSMQRILVGLVCAGVVGSLITVGVFGIQSQSNNNGGGGMEQKNAESEVGSQGGRQTKEKDDLQAITADLAQLLKWWGVKKELPTATDAQRNAVINEFFEFLSQKRFKGKLTGDHPDVIFVKRLPEEPKLPRASLPLAIQHLKKHLTRGDTREEVTQGKEKEWALKRLSLLNQQLKTASCRELAILLDYDWWWEKYGRWHTPCTGEEECDPEVSNFVRGFAVTPEKPTLTEKSAAAAQEMGKHMVSWGVKGVTAKDCETRPKLVFQFFFSLLSQRETLKEYMQVKHPYVEFVKRLPTTPLILRDEKKSCPFDGPEGDANLREALNALPGSTETKNFTDRLNRIKDEMDYLKWFSRFAIENGELTEWFKNLTDEGKGVGEEINEYVTRFRKGGAAVAGPKRLN